MEPGGQPELGMLRIGKTKAATVCRAENQREAHCIDDFPEYTAEGQSPNSISS